MTTSNSPDNYWMDIERTALWVKNFAKSQDWKEAEEYAKIFKENEITAKLLPDLDKASLTELGIKDGSRQSVLLNTISRLYWPDPYRLLHSHGLPRRSGYDSIHNFNSPSHLGNISANAYFPNSSVSCSTSGIDSDQMGTQPRFSPITTRSFGTDVSSIEAQSCPTFATAEMAERPSRFGCLTLTLREDQTTHNENTIRQRFAQFNLNIEQLKKEGSTSRYLLSFASTGVAAKALIKAKDLDYELESKWHHRPSPNNPVQYVNISGKFLTIREGKSFSGEQVGLLEPDAIVTINRLKNQRARITHVVNGKDVNIGWVSLSKDGYPLLKQLWALKSIAGPAIPKYKKIFC